MQTAKLLRTLVNAVEEGGSVAVFLGEAFISFYRGGKNKVDLRDTAKLDQQNFELFKEMLTLRCRPDWSDEELHQVEQRIKRTLGLTN